MKYAKSKNLDCEILNSNHGFVSASIKGEKSSVFLKESGTHAIQRVPPTESKGRRQTSFVMVAVLPIPPKKDISMIPDKELEVFMAVGSGKGGQHRNRTYSCVRMRHKATGSEVVIDGRDQHANKREAHKILSVKVAQLKNREAKSQYAQKRRDQIGSGDGSDKIRTYNYIESRCVDHRTGKQTTDVKSVIKKGKFDLLK